MNGKKKITDIFCLALCLCCLAGCGRDNGGEFSSGSSGGLSQVGQQVKTQVMDKISQTMEDKQQELTREQENDDPDKETLTRLAALIGDTDDSLQEEMGGAGDNIQTDEAGGILSRDYTVKLFDYELTDTVALQQGKVFSSYLYLGGEDYTVWQDLLAGCLGRPVQESRDEGDEISQCVYQLGENWVVLNSSYGMQYITISGEAPAISSPAVSAP